MANRSTPYGAFNFIVNFDGAEVFGGFSDVSGIGTELTVAEYRNGNDRENHVRKVAGIHKVGDVTLKRGILNPHRRPAGAAQRHHHLAGRGSSAGASLGPARRHPAQVHRPHARCQGRRRCGDGRAGAQRPRLRNRSLR